MSKKTQKLILGVVLIGVLSLLVGISLIDDSSTKTKNKSDYQTKTEEISQKLNQIEGKFEKRLKRLKRYSE
ncbi:hypothetical protein [Candidatus Absconditicoccus praedator]|uniref:hypothetical protein n=1 Tax=Candidatus Absconditicoccus praedator TaxID=2735562 RepID=UPI001E3D6700|nr:hypothetical protein [Candidatus Absconditicoccus praedator]UFX82908.1 hypothetical protein HLG78_02125 [Candidatus Absconditicoccus praedator]